MRTRVKVVRLSTVWCYSGAPKRPPSIQTQINNAIRRLEDKGFQIVVPVPSPIMRSAECHVGEEKGYITITYTLPR